MQNKKRIDPTSFAPNCLGMAIRRTSRAVTAAFNVRLKEYDVTLPQFGLLAAIAKFPGESLSSIADLLTLDDSTLTRNLNVLKKRNLVRTEGGRGRAGLSIFITEDGKSICSACEEEWISVNSKIKAALPAKYQDIAVDVLQVLERSAVSVGDDPTYKEGE